MEVANVEPFVVDFTLTLYKSQANSDIVLVVYVDIISSLPREKVEIADIFIKTLKKIVFTKVPTCFVFFFKTTQTS